jgi:hypothetical protein
MHVTITVMQTVYSEQKSRYSAELQNSAVKQHARATVGILQGRLNSANHERYMVLFYTFVDCDVASDFLSLLCIGKAFENELRKLMPMLTL